MILRLLHIKLALAWAANQYRLPSIGCLNSIHRIQIRPPFVKA